MRFALCCALLLLPLPLAAQTKTPPPKKLPLEWTRHGAEIRSLIKDLGDKKLVVREAARDRLIKLGVESVPYLQRAKDDPDPIRRAAVRRLIKTMRWLVPKRLRKVLGNTLDDFPSLPVKQKLRGLGLVARRPHEAREGVRFLISVARFDPSPQVRQAAVHVYLRVVPEARAKEDQQALTALADEQPSARVALMRARLLLRLGRAKQGVIAARQAVTLAPRSKVARLLLLDLLVAAKQFKEALPIALQAAQASPQDLRMQIRAGEILVHAGRRKEGLARLAAVAGDKQAVKRQRLMVRLGEAYARCGEPKRAIAVFKKGLGHNPMSGQLNLALADVYRAQGEVDRALLVYLAEIRHAERASNKYRRLCQRIGDVLRSRGAGWLAEEASFFRDAQRGRRVAQVREAVGRWLYGRGLFPEAAEELRAVCALLPKRAVAWLLLGDILRDGDRLDDARQAYTQAKQLAPRAAKPVARLRELARRKADPLRKKRPAAGSAGFAFWDVRLEGKTLSGPRAVSDLAPPPLVAGNVVVTATPGLVGLLALSCKDGSLTWTFAPKAPRLDDAAPKQLGMEPVAIVSVAPGSVAAVAPRRARLAQPVLAALYNLYWRPAHRSWRVARFRGLIAYLLDPGTGKLLGRIELDRLAQVLPPFPVSRRGRLMAFASPRRNRLELELIDLVQRRPLWRASVPKSVRRPLFAGSRILVASDGGVVALDGEGKELWTHTRKSAKSHLSTGLLHVPTGTHAGIVFGTSDGRLIRLGLAQGSAQELAKPAKRQLTGDLAWGGGLLFAAERGGAVHALQGGEVVWSQLGPRAAQRTLVFSGKRLFSLNGSDDYFAEERPLLQALDPKTGAVLFQRPVARPARMVSGPGIVVAVSGGVDVAGGLRVVGVRPTQTVGARAARLAELRSAAQDALAERSYEVAAIVARKFVRRVGGPALLSDDNLAFLARILARSRRPEEARDMIHRGEERAQVAGKGLDRWTKLRKELGLELKKEEDE